jgi:hypothetical protein
VKDEECRPSCECDQEGGSWCIVSGSRRLPNRISDGVILSVLGARVCAFRTVVT